MNFEGLVEMLKNNREQPTVEEFDLAQNLCPNCLVALKTNQKGERSCPMCGENYAPI